MSHRHLQVVQLDKMKHSMGMYFGLKAWGSVMHVKIQFQWFCNLVFCILRWLKMMHKQHTISLKWVMFMSKSLIDMYTCAQNRKNTNIYFPTTNSPNMKWNFTACQGFGSNLEMISLLSFQLTSLLSLCNWLPRFIFARCKSVWKSPNSFTSQSQTLKGCYVSDLAGAI